jgi:succinate dehydrogenase/fumarate reductase flavoprotein subunit
MRFRGVKRDRCDVFVIGGGGAGLRAAVAAREAGADTVLVSKARVGYSNNTFISKATIAATGFGLPDDDAHVHEKDTFESGRFLNDTRLVGVMARRIHDEIRFLQACGVLFHQQGKGLRVIHTPGHTYPRHVSVPSRRGGDLILPLRAHASNAGVRFGERIFVSKILTSDNEVRGVCGFDEAGDFRLCETGCVVLATGGFGQVYLHNNNAPGLTGDGHALALEAGVSLRDMEFVQFYPTALGKLGGRLLLYEGPVFEGGAILRNAQGEDILLKHGLKDPKLATRDRVSQVLTQEILEGRGVGGGVVMDLGKLAEAMPASLRMQLPANWTPSLRHLTVSPTTHFCMGGVIAGPDAATSLPGLFAAGEVCGGVHGANRLGGNALAEVFVMGAEAGASAAGLAKNIETAPPSELEIHAEKARLEDLGVPEGREAHECAQRLKQVMWQHGSIVRSGEGLQQALSAIEKLGSEEAGITVKSPRDLRAALEFRNMRLVSEMVCRAALMRTESRGAHFRVDFPEEDGRNWVKCIVLTKGEGGVRLAPAASGAAAKPRDIIRSS